MDGVVDALLSGLKVLFVPSDDFLDSKVSYLTQKFGFVTAIVNSMKQIVTSFIDYQLQEPPVVEINLAAATSKYDYGDMSVVLDFSWYAPYRNTVNAFLRAILWVPFIWRLFVALPNIISGTAGFGGFNEVDGGMQGRIGMRDSAARIEDKSGGRRRIGRR